MKNTQTYTGTLRVIERMKNSTNGNPRFLVMVGDTVARTLPDAGYSYTIGNLEGQKVRAVIGEHRGRDHVASIDRA